MIYALLANSFAIKCIVFTVGFLLLVPSAYAKKKPEAIESINYVRPSLLLTRATPKPVTAPKPKVNKTIKKSNAFSLKKLPLQYEDWTLDIGDLKGAGQSQCVARNAKPIINDGQSSSSAIVEVTNAFVRVLTDSTIDISYPDTGIKIDDNEQFPLDSVFSDTNVEFDFDVDVLIAQMRKGQKATITLGFWPTWPVTQSYSTEVSLVGFTKVMQKLKSCEQLLAKR